MTPDEHLARAEECLRQAEETFQYAVDTKTGADPEWPMIHREVQSLAALAQAHAALAAQPPAGHGATTPPQHVPTNEVVDHSDPGV